jgi:tRNA(Ile)-lysidine synthetase-like protein
MNLVVAVSGGVDSVVLLHSLVAKDSFTKKIPYQKLIVAHFEHGIRSDSLADGRFVEALAVKYKLDFHVGEGQLGVKASESEARRARWDFLNQVVENNQAVVATAHHSDDRRETQLINLLRGTGRMGLSPLNDNNLVLRPLINKTKKQIYQYALDNNLEWVEDKTNLSDDYLRNRIRHHLIGRKSQAEDLKRLFELIDNVDSTNTKIQPILEEAYKFTVKDNQIMRQVFVSQPRPVRLEMIRRWLSNFRDKNYKYSKRQSITAKQIQLIDTLICSDKAKVQRDVAGKTTLIIDLKSAKLLHKGR